MHFALVNQWYPPESHGGVAAHNYYFTIAVARLGHHVSVITASNSGRVKYEKAQGCVDVYRIPSPNLFRYRRLPIVGPHVRFIQALIRSKQAVKFLKDLQRTTPVDIVEFAEVNAEGFFWRKGVGKRLAVRCQTPAFVLARYYTKQEMPYNSALLGWAEKHVIRQADILLAPSNDMAKVVTEDCGLSPGQFHVIPDALDTDLFSPDPSIKKSNTQINILFVGRFERVKGLEVLVEAIPRVCQEIPQAHFILIGNDRPRAEGGSMQQYVWRKLERQIEAKQVDIRGSVPQEELIQNYRQAHIAVNPSLLYESFSYTCAQAMACQVAVVASRIAGIPETLDQGRAGMLVTPGDVNELAEALILMCQDEVKRDELAEAGRKRAEICFNASIIAKRNLDLFQSVLESQSDLAGK